MSLFIAFEGPDGSGKSTQARLLAAELRRRGEHVTETREPGGTPVGEAVREVLLSPVTADATALAMVFLLSASRTELVHKVIRPALAAGRYVVADRFAASTLAYQAHGLGMDIEDTRAITRIATGGLQPDVSVYVDVQPDVGVARAASRGERNWLDERTLSFHAAVRAGYQRLIAEEPERWVAVSGDAPPEAVHDAILRQLGPWLEVTREPA
jgi:dTMP kinase